MTLLPVVLACAPACAWGYTPRGVDPGPSCPDKVQVTKSTLRTGALVIAPPVIDLQVEPGEVIDQCVLISNRRGYVLDIALLGVDVDAAPSGQEGMVIVGHGKYGIQPWLRVPNKRLTLEPGDTAVVPFQIRVPDKPEVGTSHGAIIASGGTDDVVQTTIKSSLAMQLVLTVPGHLTHDLRVGWLKGPRRIRGRGPAVYRFEVDNHGNVLEHVRGRVTFESLTGREVGKVVSEEGRVLRDGHRGFQVVWNDRPWFGRFTPKLHVKGDVSSVDKEYPPVWVFPPLLYVVGLALSLLLPLGVLVYVWRRRAREYAAALAAAELVMSDGPDEPDGPGFGLSIDDEYS